MKVYFAGPDVFLPNAIDFGRTIKQAAEARGIEALYPLDNEIKGANPYDVSKEIFLANCKMIRESEGVIANLNAFRGAEPDSGTAFEVGMALALDKPILAYCNDADSEYIARVFKEGLATQVSPKEPSFDKQGMLVENFDLPFNLMLAHSCFDIVKGDVFDAMNAFALEFGLGNKAKPA